MSFLHSIRPITGCYKHIHSVSGDAASPSILQDICWHVNRAESLEWLEVRVCNSRESCHRQNSQFSALISFFQLAKFFPLTVHFLAFTQEEIWHLGEFWDIFIWARSHSALWRKQAPCALCRKLSVGALALEDTRFRLHVLTVTWYRRDSSEFTAKPKSYQGIDPIFPHSDFSF